MSFPYTSVTLLLLLFSFSASAIASAATVNGTNLAHCLQCAADVSLSTAASMGCANCYRQPAEYRQGCIGCLKQFNRQSSSNGTSNVNTPSSNSSRAVDALASMNCGPCAQQKFQSNNAVGQACYGCVASASSASGGGFCSNLVSLSDADHG